MSKNTLPNHPIILGVGASAGGLEAFQQFITGLPDEHELVIILIQHLDPDHESLMPELIAAKTKSPVHSASDEMEIESGHIYLMPPGYEMEIEGRILRLKKFQSPRGLRRPIDRFFKSLASEHGENAIAIVLSGTGSDGAQGAREIKGNGGLVFVQDPKQAKYDGMPQSVLDLSGADVVSSAEEIIDVVRDYFNLRQQTGTQSDFDTNFLERVMRHVRFRTGHDFQEYKEGTMRRRVAVRMSVLNITAPNDYLRYIAENKVEADMLFRDLLINVTSFFRDQQHFDVLKEDVIPQLVAKTEEHGELRIWIAGCSTGEEAYSIAMLVSEEISRIKKQCKVTIFGTDIDEQALATARLGRYPDSTVDLIPASLLDRYFVARSDGYEVGPVLREMVRFSRHSFIKDPPFSKLDMVSCRNVLIYLKDSLQDLAMRVFHYALIEDGYLFLGPSENPKSSDLYFTEKASRARIFQRREGPAKPLNLGTLSGSVLNRLPRANEPKSADPAFSEVERVMLEEFSPAYLHVNAENEVIFASQNATKYLSFRAGKTTQDIFSLVLPELESVIRRAARVDTGTGSVSEVEFQGEIAGEEQRVMICSRRMADGSQIYVFKDKLQLQATRDGSTLDGSVNSDLYVRQLETELDDAKQKVRTTVEELETSNEELKSSNEEMMSMNEELQSANEELTTINDELQAKVRELNQANIDMSNFVASARIPTVFLDEKLQLKKYTPEAEEYFGFNSSDIGRDLRDISSELDEDSLIAACEKTLQDQQEREAEYTTRDGSKTVSVRFMLYAPYGKDVSGVVFTMQDITQLKQAIHSTTAAKNLAETRMEEVEQIYATSPMAMGLISDDMKYLRLNKKLAEINGISIEDIQGKTIREVIPAVADQTEPLVRKVFETGEAIRNQRVTGTIRSKPDDPRVWESDWLPFYTGGKLTAVAVNVRDITSEVQISDNLRQIMRELEHRVKNMLANVTALINRAARDVKEDRTVFETLAKRVQGLAQTHSLLTAEQWSSASLRDIIEPETISIYGEDRVSLSGPKIRVTSEATLALGMAVHELATNAAKYGAFSAPDGRVDISWSRINDAASDRLRLVWQEIGGPAVEKPTRQGFGSQLIRSTLEQGLDGKVSYDWEPTGLSVVIELNFSEITNEHRTV